MEDGIHRDGTFLQHNGILYNGNYGKDLVRPNVTVYPSRQVRSNTCFSSMPLFNLKVKQSAPHSQLEMPRETPLPPK